MALLSALTDIIHSTFAVDVVGVFTPDFKQVFPKARPLKATVKEDSKLMEHPVETGATITDHRIILPVEIELALVLQAEDYSDTYQAIKQIFANATLLTVQTRTGLYENQVIQSLPHEETPEMYDAISIALKLKEVQFVTPQYQIVPRNPAKKTTVDRGVLQSKDVAANDTKKTSALKKIFS